MFGKLDNFRRRFERNFFPHQGLSTVAVAGKKCPATKWPGQWPEIVKQLNRVPPSRAAVLAINAPEGVFRPTCK